MKHLTMAKKLKHEAFNTSSHRFIASSLHHFCCPALSSTPLLTALTFFGVVGGSGEGPWPVVGIGRA
jgi:hypothetical protein